MRDGIYRLYRLYAQGEQQRLIGRFAIEAERCEIYEDHDDGFMESLLGSDGRVTEHTLMRLKSMEHSPYWRLVNEEDIQAGLHDDLLPKREG